MKNLLIRGGVAAAALVALVVPITASPVSEPTNGPKRVDARWHALTGATVVVRPGETIENATVVVRDGVIRSVGAGGRVPDGAREWDLSGHTLYAGFIEAHKDVEAPAVEKDAPGSHWRENVTPERSALDGAGLDEKGREALRKLGFTAAAIAPDTGLFRGTGELISLAEPETEISAGASRLILGGVYQSVSPETGGWGGTPPTSLMGAIAIMRQVFLDAGWYAQTKQIEAARSDVEPVERNAALEALGENNGDSRVILFDAETSLNALRMAKIAREFERRAMLLGSGREFERVEAIAGLGLPLVVPVNYPETPGVGTRAEAESVSLKTLMSWEQAPTNLRRLDVAGASVAVTTHRLKKTKDFWPNVRKAVEHGLSADRALAMLTTNPAEMLGASEMLGSVEAGKLAHFTVFEGDPFVDGDATLREVWVGGTRHEIEAKTDDRFGGAWDVRAGSLFSGTLTIDGSKATLEQDDEKTKASRVEISEDRLSFVVGGAPFGDTGAYRMSGVLTNNSIRGEGFDADGERFAWSASRAADEDEEDDDEETDDEATELPPEDLPVPFGAYGWLNEEPRQETVLITGATLWTQTDEGIIEDGALLVRRGEIVYAGPASRTPRMGVERTIDARGKHVTSGLFDAHSHMGISGGVNEGGQAVTSEVRIQDVINPDDVAWYRALAGGLTTANQLHGSANPIGGQNTVVKLRWGASDPDDFLIDSAPGGIKFALGENVKRRSGRYPDTRMGIEAIIRDRFHAAREYERRLNEYVGLNRRQQGQAIPVRRDLELDALVEILNGERLIHCHSYRQDEILMLCRVAEDFGFKIGTFQHVLEGYKVAEAIAEHALGGSSFSDWWAYKFEVYDAIPHNGALMHEAGVVVTFNSDSNELARRMNTEASKAVRYGGVDPEDALDFVTLNAAIQFKVDDRIGTLEAGKDADFVIWSGDPLSTLSRCEMTFIDGAEYFSLERDAMLRERDGAERRRIIQKILSKGLDGAEPEEESDDDNAGELDEPPPLADARLEAIGLEMMRAGLDPNEPTCGECGFMDRTGTHAGHHHAHHSEGGAR